VLAQTNALRSQSDKLRAPLAVDVRATLQEGDQCRATQLLTPSRQYF